MKHKLIGMAIILSLSLYGCSTPLDQEKPLTLWYNQPATEWMTEALPFGNGYMGAMFFGGIEQEQIQFTEGTLWSGGPASNEAYNYGTRPGAWKHLEEIRRLLKDGKFERAHRLASKELTGSLHKHEGSSNFGDYGAQQTMGDLYIDIQHKGQAQNYRRELDITTAEGRVSYSVDGIDYQRTYFGCYPQKLLVYRLESTEASNYQLQYKSPHITKQQSYKDGLYLYEGAVKDNGMAFATGIRLDTDGKVAFEGALLKVNKATYLNVYHTAATSYEAKYPDYQKANNVVKDVEQVLSHLKNASYDEIRAEHLADYQSLYKRVELDLGSNNRDTIPTNERLLAYHDGAVDPGLEQLYFQYSRYLMISASRPGTMPLSLQGKWNNSVDPPWACDYHMNINQQMLYWPGEVTNLSECHTPLFNYMESLVEPGRISAREFYNARGWIVNTMNNPFGYTAPGWGFPWGFFPGGAAWLCQHTWEHYAFNQDKEYLQQVAYPLMKEAALFWIDYLIEDENGYLVSCPSYSPEHGGISTGASMDHQMAWDLLNNCVKACEVLDIDADFKALAAKTRDRICPPMVGKWGQLQEWKEDLDDPKNHHRHVSHLFALHPGSQISVDQTKEWADAAQISLNARGDSGTGWSLGWKVNFWARLKDGDRAYKLFRRLLKPTSTKGEEMMYGGGSYSNLLCAHPPFQLDGNMGGCAGLAEMMVQSHAGAIELLPAIPQEWKNGSVKGLKARGNFEVAISWSGGELKEAQISGKPGSESQVRYKNDVRSFVIPENGVFTYNPDLK